VLRKKRQHPIILEFGRRHGRLPVIQGGESDLTVGINERLLVNPPRGLERARREGILGPTIPGVLTLKFPVGFLVGRRLLSRDDDLRFGEHEPLLGHLRLQSLEPFAHRLQIMP
jgi:hypothetical protein